MIDISQGRIFLSIIKHRETGGSTLDWVRNYFRLLSAVGERQIVEDRLHDDGRYFALTWDLAKTRRSFFQIWTGTIVDHGSWLEMNLASEHSGLAELDAPPWLIHLAPPPQTGAAELWRRGCLARARQSAGGLAYGSILTFAEPISFPDGHTATVFSYMPGRATKGGAAFRSIKNNKFYPIFQFMDRSYTVEMPPSRFVTKETGASQMADALN